MQFQIQVEWYYHLPEFSIFESLLDWFLRLNDGNMIVTNVYQLILLEGFPTGFQRPIF